MLNLAIVAAGGAIGASLRHLVGTLSLRLGGREFPWGTLAVNLAGCLAMGLFIGVAARRLGLSNELRLFVATGILGGFTTFSAFSLDVVTLWERGPSAAAVLYGLGSVFGSLLALLAGLWLARSLG
jgi:CrcB protein